VDDLNTEQYEETVVNLLNGKSVTQLLVIMLKLFFF